jgi:hypothetical protein
LEGVVPVDDFARVFFVVDEDPPFATKFKSGEWFYRGRCASNAPDPNTFCVRLSRFRNADDFARMMTPKVD